MTWVFRSRSLHYLFTVRAVSVAIEESDCVFQRGRAQVHVHLRRRQVLVSGQFLDRFRRGAPHRQVRAEGVPQQMDAGVGAPRVARGSTRVQQAVVEDYDLWLDTEGRETIKSDS